MSTVSSGETTEGVLRLREDTVLTYVVLCCGHDWYSHSITHSLVVCFIAICNFNLYLIVCYSCSKVGVSLAD